MLRRKCRIWWPKQLASNGPCSSSLLFGWFLNCSSTSLEIVVAFVSDEVSSTTTQSCLQEILRDTDGNMPLFLQEKAAFSLLGHCAADAGGDGQFPKVGMKKDDQANITTNGYSYGPRRHDLAREDYGWSSCFCSKLDGILEQYKQASIRSSHWIQLVYDYTVHYVYETPKYGQHHFSLSFGNSSDHVKAPLKKPKWVDELHRKQPLNDLETVILATNSASAAKIVYDRHEHSKRSSLKFSIIDMLFAFTMKFLAMTVASLATLFHTFIQFFYTFLSVGSETWILAGSARMLSTTCVNIQIRCSQILYWPIYLKHNDLRSQSCVEYAEKAALHKHSMWSTLAVDVILGNLMGFGLLFHAESVCLWVISFVNESTNVILRSGCVWLMGVPAGFKLNTELAEVLGMISLNAIQIWSTLWIFMGSTIIYFIKALALLGIIFGATIPAALIIDIISFATLHIFTLHWLMSLLYSHQIQALVALWRLFRGRKWNPLRQRLDSYDYTVKQHIVGSLLCAPLLLLLPTTSVFYIFFTIVNTTISSISILIEVTISIIYATPYIKILLWLLRPKRFPSGIWFQVVTCRSSSLDHEEVVSRAEFNPPTNYFQEGSATSVKISTVLVSFLQSNTLSMGHIAAPHYKRAFSGVSISALAISAYGILTGKRTSPTLGIASPPTEPWVFTPLKEYWSLCYSSIIACTSDHSC